MEKLKTMVLHLVTSARAQANLTGGPIQFHPQRIPDLQKQLDVLKNMPTSDEMILLINKVKTFMDDSSLDCIMIRAYLVGYLGCLNGDSKDKIIESIKMMTGKEIAFN